MKKCPLCGKEYETENICPICNILLIDTDSNCAVSNESEKERKRREQREQRDLAKEQAKEQAKETAAQAATQAKETAAQVVSQAKSMDPKLLMLIGAGVVILILIIVILKFVLGGKEEPQYVQPSGTGTVTEDMAEDVELNEEDFARNELVDFETDSFSFQLPAYWKDLCGVDVYDDYISFYQKKSSEYGGYLFSVAAVSSEDRDSLNNYTTIKEDGNVIYVVEYPSDVSYDVEDEYVSKEYQRLEEDVHYVFDTFEGFKEEESALTGDYIIPDSSTRVISSSELESLTKEELMYARNEIYARHGRKFQDSGIQAYFNSKSWYNGTIEPEAFQESMLNSVEYANVQTIVKYEESKGYR